MESLNEASVPKCPRKNQDKSNLDRDLQFLSRIDLVRVFQDIAIVVPDGLPLDAVFAGDLGQVVAGFHRVRVLTAAGGRGGG
jgi:hypothetical protein